MKWKYIMLHVGENDYPVIFPAFLKHKDVAVGLQSNVFGAKSICSAGFIEHVTVGAISGGSTSLNLKCDVVQDCSIIAAINVDDD